MDKDCIETWKAFKGNNTYQTISLISEILFDKVARGALMFLF